ncbi:corticoliberin-1-like [Micropterus salmoides]|uniref:corticoliberin-1-like n=1 Tax=Micropterus salmoides TaxID=27706 RepID=UPI0018ECB54E|nr:corticoliberin-1-like [Micropterus salmoides]
MKLSGFTILCFLLQTAAEMKLNVLLWVVALLAALLPRSADCRPADAPASRRLLLPRPLLLRLGEEFSLRLGGGGAPDLLSSSSSSSAVNRALLQLTQRLLQARAEQQQQQQEEEEEEAGEKGKRSDEPPISLDLTFHLLREVLEMARAEQIAQQADSNRKMMDTFGK